MVTTAVDYEWDAFISYRRCRLWPKWVRTVFDDTFEHWLSEELGRDPNVFIDERNLETGRWWDQELAINLSRSRVLVPLFSPMYFTSEWCRTELAIMRAREETLGLRTPQRRNVLILPAVLHDGARFPAAARRLGGVDFHAYSNVRMAQDSKTHELLEIAIRDWVPGVAEAIRDAPRYRADWEKPCIDRFLTVFESQIGVPEKPRLE